MATWTAGSQGFVYGYDHRVSGATGPQISLASPGSVDAQGILRAQYEIGSPIDDRLRAEASIYFSPTDISSNPGKRLTLTMFVVSSAYFAAGKIPSPEQITSVMATGYRATTTVNTSGTYYFTIYGPRPTSLQPNTKYWVLILPTAVKTSVPSNTSNDRVLAPYSPNDLGRAVSMWTNRTPLAPTILSPDSGGFYNPGDTFVLKYLPNDPDSTAAEGMTDTNRLDLAGVQVQYAPRPTKDNPNPTWSDLPIGTFDSPSKTGDGWFIDSSQSNEPNDGGIDFWTKQQITVRTGGGSPIGGEARLPSGDWQIRVRVFDYGHPFPDVVYPLDSSTGNLTPASFPASNKSPWSQAVFISVDAQVPAPVPLSPVDSIAISAGSQVTLTWAYRNTHKDNLKQASRTVDIRKDGQTAWTTLASGSGSAASLTVPSSYVLEESTEYEWRVRVSDTSGSLSDYSEVARFWIVPAPNSGEQFVLPSDTIDGATLGCGRHRAFIYRRGGKVRVGEITGMTKVEWNRVRDDISDAEVSISDWGPDCGEMLADIRTWAYELVIFRDNGYSVDRVWEGPITRITYKADEVNIHARDVMGYVYRRIIKQAMNDKGRGDTVTGRATRIIQNAFTLDDPNVLRYLTIIRRADDAKEYRNTPAYSRTAFEEIDDMAANHGLDYTAVGRSIIVWGTKHGIGRLPEFRDENLGESPIVSEYGMSMANLYSVSDGNGVHGEAHRLSNVASAGPSVSGNDPVYGRVEVLSSTWASDSETDADTFTQEGLEKVRESFEGFAERSISDRYPAPVVVRVPDNTSVHPDTVVSIQQLVPGVVIPLRSTATLRIVAEDQKLDRVTVVEEAGQETVSLMMSPFGRDDAEMTEGEEV